VASKQPERDVGEPLFLTHREAAKKIGISRSLLYQLLRNGELTNVEFAPQVRRIPFSECEAMAQRRIAEAKAKNEARRAQERGAA
jgi:excisionase family DNA binding protein